MLVVISNNSILTLRKRVCVLVKFQNILHKKDFLEIGELVIEMIFLILRRKH